MRIFRGFDDLPKFNGAVASVGSFDGVHCGHAVLLNRCVEIARKSGGESVVLTFETHPRVVLKRAEGLRLLTTLEEKIEILESVGIDNLIVIPFDKDFSRLTHESFVRNYLVGKVGVKSLVVGYNHHFGRDSEGGFNSVNRLSEEYGIEIVKIEEWRSAEDDNISSTVVRSLFARGEVDRALELLKRSYLILAQVDGDGRVWCSDALKLLPSQGRYRALIDGNQGIVTVDADGVMWCKDVVQKVRIEILGKAEGLDD